MIQHKFEVLITAHNGDELFESQAEVYEWFERAIWREFADYAAQIRIGQTGFLVDDNEADGI